MKYSRVLITGCGGMLGNAVYPYFKERFEQVRATDKDTGKPWLEELDIRDTDKVAAIFERFQPDLVLHLAANTDLEYCELNPEFAEENNAKPSTTLGKLAEAADATLLYISTAGVFDGEKEGLYEETDKPNPLMVYGRTKLNGEILAHEACSRTFVLRAGWMVGGGPGKDHKFVSLILDQIIAGKKVIHAVNDKLGTPTYTHDFALNMFELLETEHYGTYHMVCEGTGSRYDVACEIARICNRPDIELKPVSSDFFMEKYFAPRPYSEMMLNANLRKLGLNRMRPWKDALHEYITREFPHAISQ